MLKDSHLRIKRMLSEEAKKVFNQLLIFWFVIGLVIGLSIGFTVQNHKTINQNTSVCGSNG
jgi:hypothetical protein